MVTLSELGKSMDDGFRRSNAFRKGKFITRVIIYSNKEKALLFSQRKRHNICTLPQDCCLNVQEMVSYLELSAGLCCCRSITQQQTLQGQSSSSYQKLNFIDLLRALKTLGLSILNIYL